MPKAPVAVTAAAAPLDLHDCVRISWSIERVERHIWIELESALILRCDDEHRLTRAHSRQLYRELASRLDAPKTADEPKADRIEEMRKAFNEMLASDKTPSLTYRDSTRFYPATDPELDDSEFEIAPATE